jgi:chitin synthase
MSKRPHQSARRPTNDSDMDGYGLSDNGALSPGAPSPGFHAPTGGVPTTPSAGDFGRKRSLVRPERTRIDKDHPQYHYRQHATKQGMNVLPSTTGNDPILEDHTAEAASASSDSTDLKSLTRPPTQRFSEDGFRNEPKRVSRKLTRKESVKKQAKKENVQVISLWTVYCAIITFWMPNAVLKCFGKVQKEQQRAWREKMGLISIILCIMAFVGFITFGFTQAVCDADKMNIKINKVDGGYLIIHGKAYNLVDSEHPVAIGMPKPLRKSGPNVLYDLPDLKNGGTQRNGGKDASFMFQNVNGECKGMIKPVKDSDVPQDGDKVAWYFPCVLRNQDGSSKFNQTDKPPYLGYACHTSKAARDAYYGLQEAGDVFFTWEDLRNKSRRLTTFSGHVLDLDLLNWFNTSQVSIPAEFKDLQKDQSILGVDITHKFQSSKEKKLAKCLSEIIRVGSIDTQTVGCIASKVVLYVSLVFIVAIVLAKFVLALFFSWFLSWRLGAQRTKGSVKEMKQRRNEIEDWSEDIYAPPPKLRDVAGPDRANKRGSFLPTTSRFTSPYAHESAGAPKRNVPTTMASQSASRLLPPSPMYRQNNGSNGSLQDSSLNLPASSMGERLSAVYSEDTSGIPMGFIHDQVVPQPPPDFKPFGFPLIHNICLVTAYSEGPEGMRTTLDSLATTDYPNSHKMILIICDGLIKGHGETRTTPDVCLSMMKDFLVPPEHVRPFSYVAVATGAKRHNMAKVYAGFYDYGQDSKIPPAKQQRVPILCVVKCGTPEEKTASKPGNRGKRDSQIILMSFLQKVMFDERMTELEYEMFNGIWRITGISPDFYETVLMVDADTKVFPDSLTHMIAAMVHDPEVMGLCGETKIANKTASWVSRIQVFE